MFWHDICRQSLKLAFHCVCMLIYWSRIRWTKTVKLQTILRFNKWKRLIYCKRCHHLKWISLMQYRACTPGYWLSKCAAAVAAAAFITECRCCTRRMYSCKMDSSCNRQNTKTHTHQWIKKKRKAVIDANEYADCDKMNFMVWSVINKKK